jgi:murein DD-endopeptidase MepM/ murein hydrolase activator NlpD
LVAQKEHSIAQAKLRLESVRTAVQGARQQKAKQLDARDRVIAQKRALLSANQNHVGRLRAQIAEQQRESDHFQALLQSSSSSVSVAPAQGNARFMWPVSGPITSGFGWRINPITHSREMHPGIDIGVPEGTPIAAAGTGVVVFAGAESGYGNYILIDHGGGLATGYGHLSVIGVSTGQHVSEGSTIGNSGCTGWCTGPHLHFEVRVNGTPVNPLPYLP